MAKWIHFYRVRLTQRQGSTRLQIGDNEAVWQVFRERFGSMDEFLVVTYDLKPVKATGKASK